MVWAFTSPLHCHFRLVAPPAREELPDPVEGPAGGLERACLAKSLRKQIVAVLTKDGMSRRQAEETLEIDVRDLQVDIRRSLAQENPPGGSNTFGSVMIVLRK